MPLVSVVVDGALAYFASDPALVIDGALALLRQ